LALALRLEESFEALALPDSGALVDVFAAHVRTLGLPSMTGDAQALGRLISFHAVDATGLTRVHTHGLAKFASPELELVKPSAMTVGIARASLSRWAAESIMGSPLVEGRQLFAHGGEPFMVHAADAESRDAGAGFTIVSQGTDRRAYFNAFTSI
jgi:hypothetical protein